jgi:hypothetical protein
VRLAAGRVGGYHFTVFRGRICGTSGAVRGMIEAFSSLSGDAGAAAVAAASWGPDSWHGAYAQVLVVYRGHAL